MSACLSEVPLNQVQRLIDRHGPWGIGFKKSLIRKSGGGRVWYVDEKTSLQEAISDSVAALLRDREFDAPFWRVTPFIDLVSPARSYEFEWEREWRVPGGLPFSYTDVAFVWPNQKDGADKIVEEIFADYRPAWTPSGEVIGGIDSNLSAVGAEGDRLIEEFFQAFADPINELYYDEGGGYIWPASSWSTEAAVDDVFPQLEPTLRSSLIEVLQEVCTEWLRLSDLL
jgi:hypothetical protein